MKTILAIDPGDKKSGWCIIDEKYNVIDKGKDLNDIVNKIILEYKYDHLVIEKIQSYGGAVGQTIFDTCIWIGRFIEIANIFDHDVELLYRRHVKLNLCSRVNVKDTHITQSLIDRFSYERHKDKNGKGTKNDQGFFYGFKADIWQAFALAVTYLDIQKGIYKIKI